jgi:hypothetical protein
VSGPAPELGPTARSEKGDVNEDSVRTWIGPEKRSESDPNSVYTQLFRVKRFRNRHAHLAAMRWQNFIDLREIVLNDECPNRALLHRVLDLKDKFNQWRQL